MTILHAAEKHPLISRLEDDLKIPLGTHSFVQGLEGNSVVFVPTEQTRRALESTGLKKVQSAVNEAAADLNWGESSVEPDFSIHFTDSGRRQ